MEKSFKNEINLLYIGNKKEEQIFGDKFVENNKNNIELEINGKRIKLIGEYELNENKNNIKMILKIKVFRYK